MKIYRVLVLGLVLVSCNDDSKLENEIAKIETNYIVERFDNAFFNAESKDLPKLKDAYPFLFSKRIPDSIWVDRINDSLQNVVLSEVTKTFEDFKDVDNELKQLFQHLKYYDKAFNEPRVITLTNNVDYRSKVIVNDSIILVALDNYLGESHRFYTDSDIPIYKAKNFNRAQIVPDFATEYAKKYTFQTQRKTLLDEMIYFGKLLYFKDVMIPFKTDAEKMGYSQDQLKWAEANESAIWSHFIEEEMLYSTDSKLPNRFIADAPFSKFYLDIDNQSPGRLGQYIGWQIVRAYAESTDVDMMRILQTEPEQIFRKSNFKPKK